MKAILKHRIDKYDIDRLLGTLSSQWRIGPAVPQPTYHKLLMKLGILEHDPISWQDPEILQRLPYGSRPVAPATSCQPSGLDGLWPQKSILHQDFYPSVLGLPLADRKEHFIVNASRYLGQVARHWPQAAYQTQTKPRLATLTDETFLDLFLTTSLSQIIQLYVEPSDAEIFAKTLPDFDHSSTKWATIDLTFVPKEHLLPNLKAFSTVALLEVLGNQRYRLTAILADDKVLKPSDGAAWEIARYMLLANAGHHLMQLKHTRLHLGIDALNAITRSFLPASHRIHRLLRPHMRYTLGLHEAVIHHRRSVFHNSQREIYAGFAYDANGTHALLKAGRAGFAGRRAYPPYLFETGLFGEHVSYGCYRKEWFEIVRKFVAHALNDIDPKEDLIQLWAHHISNWVPGFPDPIALKSKDLLFDCLATYICTVSVFHTADHHAYSSIEPQYAPLRIRKHFSQVIGQASLDRSSILSKEDHFRHLLCHRMFFKPVILSSLADVTYELADEDSQQAIKNFRQDMQALDQKWAQTKFPKSHEIATSLQY